MAAFHFAPVAGFECPLTCDPLIDELFDRYWPLETTA
jgi:hypothetical protein